MSTIQHKIIGNCPDSVCAECYQNFDGECRAYSFPESDEERNWRHRLPEPLCMALVAVTRRVEQLGRPLETREKIFVLAKFCKNNQLHRSVEKLSNLIDNNGNLVA